MVTKVRMSWTNYKSAVKWVWADLFFSPVLVWSGMLTNMFLSELNLQEGYKKKYLSIVFTGYCLGLNLFTVFLLWLISA